MANVSEVSEEELTKVVKEVLVEGKTDESLDRLIKLFKIIEEQQQQENGRTDLNKLEVAIENQFRNAKSFFQCLSNLLKSVHVKGVISDQLLARVLLQGFEKILSVCLIFRAPDFPQYRPYSYLTQDTDEDTLRTLHTWAMREMGQSPIQSQFFQQQITLFSAGLLCLHLLAKVHHETAQQESLLRLYQWKEIVDFIRSEILALNRDRESEYEQRVSKSAKTDFCEMKDCEDSQYQRFAKEKESETRSLTVQNDSTEIDEKSMGLYLPQCPGTLRRVLRVSCLICACSACSYICRHKDVFPEVQDQLFGKSVEDVKLITQLLSIKREDKPHVDTISIVLLQSLLSYFTVSSSAEGAQQLIKRNYEEFVEFEEIGVELIQTFSKLLHGDFQLDGCGLDFVVQVVKAVCMENRFVRSVSTVEQHKSTRQSLIALIKELLEGVSRYSQQQQQTRSYRPPYVRLLLAQACKRVTSLVNILSELCEYPGCWRYFKESEIVKTVFEVCLKESVNGTSSEKKELYKASFYMIRTFLFAQLEFFRVQHVETSRPQRSSQSQCQERISVSCTQLFESYEKSMSNPQFQVQYLKSQTCSDIFEWAVDGGVCKFALDFIVPADSQIRFPYVHDHILMDCLQIVCLTSWDPRVVEHLMDQRYLQQPGLLRVLISLKRDGPNLNSRELELGFHTLAHALAPPCVQAVLRAPKSDPFYNSCHRLVTEFLDVFRKFEVLKLMMDTFINDEKRLESNGHMFVVGTCVLRILLALGKDESTKNIIKRARFSDWVFELMMSQSRPEQVNLVFSKCESFKAEQMYGAQYYEEFQRLGQKFVQEFTLEGVSEEVHPLMRNMQLEAAKKHAKVDISQEEVLKVIHEHLQMAGLQATADQLLQEAKLNIQVGSIQDHVQAHKCSKKEFQVSNNLYHFSSQQLGVVNNGIVGMKRKASTPLPEKPHKQLRVNSSIKNKSKHKQVSQVENCNVNGTANTFVSKVVQSNVSPAKQHDPIDSKLNKMVKHYVTSSYVEACKEANISHIPDISHTSRSLFAGKPVIQPPSRFLQAPSSFVKQHFRQQQFPRFGGFDGAAKYRKFKYSRFRPLQFQLSRSQTEQTNLDGDAFICGCCFMGGDMFAVSDEEGQVDIYDVNRNGDLLELTKLCGTKLASQGAGLESMVREDGQQILMAQSATGINIFDYRSRRLEIVQSIDEVYSGAFNMTGTKFAMVGREVLWLYNFGDTSPHTRINQPWGHFDAGYDFMQTDDVSYSSLDDQLLLWGATLFDTRTAEPVHTFQTYLQCTQSIFHPNGLEVIVGGSVFDVRQRKLLQTVPALEGKNIQCNHRGDVIYVTQIIDDDPDRFYRDKYKDPTYSMFSTIDARTMETISKVSCGNLLLLLSLEQSENLIATVTMQRRPERDVSMLTIFQVGGSSDVAKSEDGAVGRGAERHIVGHGPAELLDSGTSRSRSASPTYYDTSSSYFSGDNSSSYFLESSDRSQHTRSEGDDFIVDESDEIYSV